MTITENDLAEKLQYFVNDEFDPGEDLDFTAIARQVMAWVGIGCTPEGAKRTHSYYRSLTPDGKLWCESKSPDEVREMSEGVDCTFEVLHFYEVTDGWKDWK